VSNRLSCNQAAFHRMSILVESSPTHWQARQAGGHWFEPSTAHLDESPASAGFLSWSVGGTGPQPAARYRLDMATRRASCSCGQLTVEGEGEGEGEGDPVRVSICHCFACQPRTRSVRGAVTLAPRAGADWGLRDRVRADLR
jgi:hypothetical protein